MLTEAMEPAYSAFLNVQENTFYRAGFISSSDFALSHSHPRQATGNPPNCPAMNIPSLDLTTEFPRSPRDTSIAGYVVAARCLDKCRAVLNDTAGEYHSGCPLDEVWLDFAGIKYKAFRKFVSTGADDAAVSEWVSKNAKQKKSSEVISWNNKMRDKQIGKMPIKLQEFLEGYIPQFIPSDKIVRVWFDVYDIEEKRI
jgi:hypothetical protein